MKTCRGLALLLTLLFLALPAMAQKTAPPAPLTGTVNSQTWVSFDQSFSGITLTSGKPFHFNVLPPAQYNSAAYKYPLMIWLAPDFSTNSWYDGSNTDPLYYVGGEPNHFNDPTFLTAWPGFVAVPYADQTCGNDAVCNWGGWTNNGTTGSGTNFSGDTGPNTFAVLKMIIYLESIDSIDPNRIYCQGFSLGGIGCEYLMQMYNAYTGSLGKIFAAASSTGGVLEINGFGAGPTSAQASTMANVPVWWFSGANDGTSIPADWNLPMWRLLANNSSYPGAITSPAANQAGTSQMHFTLCGTCSHQDTDSAGNYVFTNPIIMNWMFGTSASVAATGTGQFSVSGGYLIDPTGAKFIPSGTNVYDEDMQVAIQNSAGFPLKNLYPGINYLRIGVCGGGDCAINGAGSGVAGQPTSISYRSVSFYTQIAAWCQTAKIVCEFEDHNSNGGYWEGSNLSLGSLASYPPAGAMLTSVTNFWSAMATQFKGNPYAWIGSLNEIGGPSYNPSDLMAQSTYHLALYNAIRATGNTNMIDFCSGFGCGNHGTLGLAALNAADYANMTNVMWLIHDYGSYASVSAAQADLVGTTAPNQDGGPGCYGYVCQQQILSHDGVMPVIFNEWGSSDGNASSTNGQNLATALQNAAASGGIGQGSYDFFNLSTSQFQQVNNGGTAGLSGSQYSLTTWGGIVAAVIAANPFPGGNGGGVNATETLAINTLQTTAANTAFTVSGSIINATSTPVLQYQNNNGGWLSLPSGAQVSSISFSFTDPGMTTPGVGNNTVSVRDANTNTIVAVSNSFTVTGSESANDSVVTASLTTASFSDNFTSLSLHNTWQAGDNWQLVSPDTPAGRGGPNFGENGDQWWVNPFNTSTPISGIYVQDAGGLHLGLLNTPSADQTYITAQAGAALPYVGGLMNTSQTNYQKYGYWQITAAVPKVNGFTFQADIENVQITGTFPPEIDLRIGTNASGVQTVLFEIALGGALGYTQFTMPTSFDPTQSHTYAWDWESNFITFYVDGVQQFQTANPSTAYQTAPMFLFLVTAANYVGNTGDPTSSLLPVSANVTAVNIYPTKPAAISSGSLVDATGEVWTITPAGQVAVNGVADSTTSGVVELAYVNHAVWYETSAGLWQFKTISTATWQPVPATMTAPLTIAESPNNTVITTVGPVITSATGTTYGISSGGQVLVNGVVDPPTANVIELAYVNHVAWQENSSGNWYSYTGLGPTTVSPLVGEVITVSTIVTQIPATGFTVTGSISGVNVTPTLQYQDNTGAWTAFPTGSTVTENSAAGIALTDMGQANSGPAPTMTMSTSAASPAGALILAIVNDGTSTLGAFTDSAGNTYTRAIGCVGGAAIQGLYYSYNSLPLASGSTITYTPLSQGFTSMSLTSVTGMNATAGVLDGSVCGSGTAAAATSGSLTPSVVNDLFVGWASSTNNSAAFTSSPGFTPPPRSAIGGAGMGGYLIDSTLAPQNYAPVASSSAFYGSILTAFKSAVGVPASSATFSLAHPGMAANPTNTINVRDANNTSVIGSSNGFAVASTTGESLSINPVAAQTANVTFTVTGTLSGITGSGSGGSNPGTPPAPAAAVGFNTLTYGPTILLGATGGGAADPVTGWPAFTGGVNWAPFTFYGTSWRSIGAVQNSDGSVTLDGTGENFGNGLSTANPPVNGVFAGQTFGNGGFFEATMKSTGPFAFWANDMESMGYAAQGDLTKRHWPGQAADYGDWIEADMSEFDSTGVYGGAMHNWYAGNICSGNSFGINSLNPPGTAGCGINTLGSGSSFNQLPTNCCAGADFTQYHNYGFLWKPATSTTQGYAKWFFDRQQVGNTITWNQYNPALAPPPVDNGTGNGSAYSIMDVRHMALILGGSPGATNTISSVQVWQADGSGDLPVITAGSGTGVPTLQYQDNGGAWQVLPAGFTVTNTTFSFAHPGVTAGTLTLSVRDANNPTVIGTATVTVNAVVGGGVTGWNPTDTSSTITLANSNQLATSTASVEGGTRAVTPQSTGKFCFETLPNTMTPLTSVGISNASYILAGTLHLGADINSIGYLAAQPGSLQSIWYANVQVILPTSTADVSGNPITICEDLTAQKEWVSTPVMRATSGVIWNNTTLTNANPATGVGGASFSGLVCPCYPTMSTLNTGAQITLNTTGPFALTLPAGFLAWQPASVILHHPFLFNFGQREPANDNADYVPARFERVGR